MSEKNDKSEKQTGKRRVSVCGHIEILPLAEIVEETGWSPEELIDRSTWGYLCLVDESEHRMREYMIEDYMKHRE